MGMKFNNIDVTNITTNRFIGVYSGVEIEIMPDETRHLPSEVARHVGLQLATQIFRKQKSKGMPEILDTILSPEIATKETEKELSVKEQIEQHENDYARFLEEKRREELLKVAEKA